TTSPSCPASRRCPRAPGSSTASGRRRRVACSRAASASTTITCASGRRSSATTPRWPSGSFRSTRSAPSRDSWPRASAWTQQRRCHRGGAGAARPGGRDLRRAGTARRGRVRRAVAVSPRMAGPKRPIRVLVAKPGLDGHDRGAKVVAAALRDAGMEVIYTGLHQTPEMIASAAVQEDVDVVGLSILSGAHMTLFPRVLELLRAEGRADILITGGGIIPREDMDALQAMGTGKLFGPGTPTSDLVEYIEEWAAAHVSA